MIDQNRPASQVKTLFSVGHSNRSLDELVDLLHGSDIRQLIDVRSQPNSRTFPLFNRSTLNQALEEEGIAYAWLGAELGGLRRGKSDSPHSALASDGFRAYADHMTSPAFVQGIDRLTTLASNTAVAIMCAERDPNQCHRNMIADYLLLRGWRIIHLIDRNTRLEHRLNPLARAQDRQPVYDRLDQEQLDLGF